MASSLRLLRNFSPMRGLYITKLDPNQGPAATRTVIVHAGGAGTIGATSPSPSSGNSGTGTNRTSDSTASRASGGRRRRRAMPRFPISRAGSTRWCRSGSDSNPNYVTWSTWARRRACASLTKGRDCFYRRPLCKRARKRPAQRERARTHLCEREERLIVIMRIQLLPLRNTRTRI
jgi:hypothetical protein